jgi:hypothetical protein
VNRTRHAGAGVGVFLAAQEDGIIEEAAPGYLKRGNPRDLPVGGLHTVADVGEDLQVTQVALNSARLPRPVNVADVTSTGSNSGWEALREESGSARISWYPSG